MKSVHFKIAAMQDIWLNIKEVLFLTVEYFWPGGLKRFRGEIQLMATRWSTVNIVPLHYITE